MTEDLQYCNTALFTKWVVDEGLLKSPLVVVDVGVQGGENVRWGAFGRCVDIYGFDPIPEVIAELNEKTAGKPNRHYYCLALGDEDKEARFYVNDANKTSSSMYLQGPTRFESRQSQREIVVAMRRLDTLLAQGMIPAPDFIKIDVEGFEKFVLQGAVQSLASCLVAEVETNFGISPVYPTGHLTSMQEALLGGYMVLHDIGFNRVPRGTFLAALDQRQYRRAHFTEVGAPGTVNALFSRDLIKERESPDSYRSPPPEVTVDQVLKILMVLESYGLSDVAVDIAAYYRARLDASLDVDRAIDLLVRSAALQRDLATSASRRSRQVSVRVAVREGIGALRDGLIDVGLSLVHSFRCRLGIGGEERSTNPAEPRGRE